MCDSAEPQFLLAGMTCSKSGPQCQSAITVEDRIDLVEIVRREIARMKPLLDGSIEVFADLSQGTRPVRMREELVRSLVMALCQRGLRAMPEGGHLLIEVFSLRLEASHHKVFLGEAKAGEYAVLSVSDTGQGIDPCSSTSPAGQHPALGDEDRRLHSLLDLLRQNSGHFWVYSSPTSGTQFEVFFPAA